MVPPQDAEDHFPVVSALGPQLPLKGLLVDISGEADGSVAHVGDLLAATAPSILDVAFLCGAVYLKLFGYGCFEPQD